MVTRPGLLACYGRRTIQATQGVEPVSAEKKSRDPKASPSRASKKQPPKAGKDQELSEAELGNIAGGLNPQPLPPRIRPS